MHMKMHLLVIYLVLGIGIGCCNAQDYHQEQQHHRIQQQEKHQYGINGMDGSISTERSNSALRCVNVNPQNSVDLQQIMGLWYGSEIIMHSQDYPGVYEYNSCVIIHLADVSEQLQNSYGYQNGGGGGIYGDNGNTEHNSRNRNTNRGGGLSTTQFVDTDDYLRRQHPRDRPRYLRLVWSEKDSNVEYTFNYTLNAPGIWSNIGDQRGSLAQLNTYTQFTGTVQVVKAVNDHLVLTFCGNDVHSSIYTVVLTRNRLGLSADELRSIRNMLSRRGLYTGTIRTVCSSADRRPAGVFMLMVLLALLWLWRRH